MHPFTMAIPSTPSSTISEFTTANPIPNAFKSDDGEEMNDCCGASANGLSSQSEESPDRAVHTLDEAFWEERGRRNQEEWRLQDRRRRLARGVTRKIRKLESDNIRLRQELVKLRSSSDVAP